MGRIDQALRRSNLDVGQMAAVQAPPPNPWSLEHGNGCWAPDQATGARGAAPPDQGLDRPSQGEETHLARMHGFDSDDERLVVSADAPALLVEQFRSLAASLHRAQAEHSIKSVFVTSASPGDGKSYVATNLALTLSDTYRRRVLLIDADMRRPALHQIFRVPNDGGLAQALNPEADRKVATVRIRELLTLVPAGRTGSNPLGGLSSDRMKRIVEEATSLFEWVIVDSPPVGVLADARLVAEAVDAAILVVRAGVTRFPDVAAAAETIGHDRILGVVLNAVEPVEIECRHYYSHYYGHEQRKV